MTSSEALVGLNMVYELGSTRLVSLLHAFEKPEKIFTAPLERLETVAGIGSCIAAKIRAVQRETIVDEIHRASMQGLSIITLFDDVYPQNLRTIPGAPLVLYVKGTLLEKDSRSIAVVGSRRASLYGLTQAEMFAKALSLAEFTIVSGMARGVDTHAHQGALSVHGRTLAVMGSGFNSIYPPENKELVEEIARYGAVISEFPLSMLPLPQNFPRRNRIISGLSLGTLVVEAARNSGALITADFALEQGRDVFALPGKVDAVNSSGTNALIQDGAKIVLGVEDIIGEYTTGDSVEITPRIEEELHMSCADTGVEPVDMYGLISNDPVTFDELVERSGLTISEISKLIIELQLKGLVSQLPGAQFIRNEHGKEEFGHS
ncbi:MAG TPA: DNA-processing protein DprA [Candidatus Omnitrophota bacterium]|nr:DNA-processing protein DprA [Candidatus Omnitrophota bacterium]HPT06813.1 DNA-processing protein DprA [Candidatus Omnitrophota bacterium]